MADSGYAGSKASCEGYVPETLQEQIQKKPPTEPPPLKHHRKKPPSNVHYVVIGCYLNVIVYRYTSGMLHHPGVSLSECLQSMCR